MINVGGQFSDFINRQNLDAESVELLKESTLRIFERTELLNGRESTNCQLVVGEVQSGKTMSFTSLIALAHENGFPIVIVLAGTKIQLLAQTSERLTRDLKADGNGGPNSWVMLEKPKRKDRATNVRTLQRALSIWQQDEAPAEFKPTVVITILKNRTSLDEVTDLLGNLSPSFDVNKYPVLIIDDEGDQAGLNLQWATDEESTIYAAIGRLRRILPRHSYVMYTATPQGPLLLNIEDTLSPKYITLLHSGPAYLGGDDLFVSNSDFIMPIPEQERPMIFDDSMNALVPDSLKHAVAYYLLALSLAQERSNPKPLSMLIHPSSQKSFHAAYETWITRLLESWKLVLLNPSELVFEKLKRDFFTPAELELKKTVKLDENWDLTEVLRKLTWWIPSVEVRVINSGKNNIDPREWLSHPGWILIGGNKLERGFTIENLAVTYMPRSTGVGNVDVIQQRGRFFGYKRKYKDLLRGWFFEDHIQAYISYVDHEKSIRHQLGEIDRNSQELSTWRRRFLLDPAYQPVRTQVISLGINHKRLSVFKQHLLFDPVISKLRDEFLERINSLITNVVPFPEDDRVESKNYYCSIDISDALGLLADWPMAPRNRTELDDIIWVLQALPEELKVQKTVLALMDYDPNSKTFRTRDRSVPAATPDTSKVLEDQAIANIFQGRSTGYPGDAEMKLDDALTIQVHLVRPLYGTKACDPVVALALIVPPNTTGFIVEATR